MWMFWNLMKAKCAFLYVIALSHYKLSFQWTLLTLNVPIPDQKRKKNKTKQNNKSLFSSFFLVIPKGFMKTETLQPLYHFEVSQKTYTYEAESRLICIKQIYRFILLANRFILLANKRCSVPNAFLPIVGKPWKTNKKEFIY